MREFRERFYLYDAVGFTLAASFCYKKFICNAHGTLHFFKKQYIYQYMRILCAMRRNSCGEEASVFDGNAYPVHLYSVLWFTDGNDISK